MMLFYIDPGTGSMLFSVVIGIAATLYFSLRGLGLKLKMKFSSKDVKAVSSHHVPLAVYCEGRQYFGVFHPILEECERRGVATLYYTGSESDPVLKEKWRHIKAECIGEGNRAYARLNFLDADICLMTTPGLDVYQLKRSKNVRKYVHILHMPSDPTTYRMFGLDFFDAVLLTGDYQKADIRYLEKLRNLPAKELVTVGCTYLDEAQKKFASLAVPDHPFTVLVAPSWGPSALLSRFGEKLLDPLAATGMQVIVRPHPQSRTSEKEMLEKLQDRYKNSANVTWDFSPDNTMTLAKADIMISDFSGVVFDYTFLRDKPVLYMLQGFDSLPYDCDDVPHELWQFSALKSFGIELKEEDLPRIGEVIISAADSQELKAARAKAKAEAWANQGHAAEKTVDWLLDAEEKIAGKRLDAASGQGEYSDYLNFCVGPVQCSEAVREVGGEQVPYFRTADFGDMMKENEKMFLALAKAPAGSRTIFLTCSGSGAMEAAVSNLLTPADKVLVVKGGSFGARFSQICEYHKIPHADIVPEPGCPVTEADLAAYDGQGYTACLVNMDETSTGVLYDMPMISRFCQKNHLFLIVDAVSAFLADPFDMAALKVGAMVTCSQKALALPPGLGFAVLSPEAIDRVGRIPCPSLYFDFKSYLTNGERGQTPFTPAVQTLRQLHVRLSEIMGMGGADAMNKKCADLARYFRQKAFSGAYPFTMFSKAPANGVTSIRVEGIDAHELFDIIRTRYHIWICPNGGDLAHTVFRVGHIGDLTERDYDRLFDAFDDLKREGVLK